MRWPLELQPRGAASPLMRWLSPPLAVLLTTLTGLAIFAALGHAPGQALAVFFVRPLADLYGLTELLVKATPLALCAMGLAVGFRANVWNIGAEGQLTLGAISGAGVALYWHDSDASWLLALMALAGVAGGMLWASVPALLRTRFGSSEILVSLMLTYVAALLLSYLLHGPWRDPQGYGFPQSRLLHDAALLPVLLADTRLHAGSLVALGALLAAWLLLSRTLLGYQLQVIGHSPGAARYAGFSEARLVWFCLLLSGGLAGLAGLFEVAGPVGQLVPNISPGYGFTAIIVAFLGRLQPFGILAAALLMALSYLGGEFAQMEMGMPATVTGVFQGMLLLYLLACDVLVNHRLAPRAR